MASLNQAIEVVDLDDMEIDAVSGGAFFMWAVPAALTIIGGAYMAGKDRAERDNRNFGPRDNRFN